MFGDLMVFLKEVFEDTNLKGEKLTISNRSAHNFTSSDFCLLLITFANSFNPDQAYKHVGTDLDSNCLTL